MYMQQFSICGLSSLVHSSRFLLRVVHSVWHKAATANVLSTAFSDWLIAMQLSAPILLYIPFCLWHILVLIKSSHCLLNKMSRILRQISFIIYRVRLVLKPIKLRIFIHFTWLLGPELALERILLMCKCVHPLFTTFCSAFLICRYRHNFMFSLCVQHLNFFQAWHFCVVNNKAIIYNNKNIIGPDFFLCNY